MIEKPNAADKNLSEDTASENGRPPIFKTWNQLYAFVLILHALIIYLFYLLTQAYS